MDALSTHTPDRTESPTRRPPVRTLLGATVALLLLAATYWAVFVPDPVDVELATVTKGPMQVTVDNQGQIRIHDRYSVAAPVAAELQRIALHDGDPVRKGQAVATLSPLPMDARQRQEAAARLESARALAREANLRVQRANADLQFATREKTRIDLLVMERFLAPQAADKAGSAVTSGKAEWQAARSREEAALADVKAAEAGLAAVGDRRRQLQLVAPVDGYVLKVMEKSERTVNAGTVLMTIGDPRNFEVVVDVLSTDAVRISTGNPMLLEGWGGGRTLRATVRLVEPVAFTKVSALGVEEQRVNVIGDLLDPPGSLGDGYRVEARIVIWSVPDASRLPSSSLFRAGDRWHVFEVEGGRAREVEVKVGQRNQDEVQILSGLDVGSTVVRYPDNRMKDGVRIERRTPAGGGD